MGEMISLTIDEKNVQVSSKTTILKAAEKLGIVIPTLCFLKDSFPLTSCMICVVRIKGFDSLMPACGTEVADGMEVDTQTEEVIEARKIALELLLSEHNGKCGTCQNPDLCKLRKYAVEFKAKWTRFKGEKNPFERFTTDIFVYEPGKCIKCGICVRICEKSGIRSGFGFLNRGFDLKVRVPFNEFESDELKRVINECVENCPTRALRLNKN